MNRLPASEVLEPKKLEFNLDDDMKECIESAKTRLDV